MEENILRKIDEIFEIINNIHKKFNKLKEIEEIYDSNRKSLVCNDYIFCDYNEEKGYKLKHPIESFNGSRGLFEKTEENSFFKF